MRSLILVFILFVTSTSMAQSTPGKKHVFSFSAMALSSSTKQGGDGPSGSTVLSHSEYVWSGERFGFGAFFQYDMQGTTEKDSVYGPKLEIYLRPFFFEFGYALSAKRAYTDRTIAEQTGDGTFYGVGARFNLGAGGTSGWFFQASYKIRTLNIKKQDGTELDEPIQQTDGYPLIGIGYQF
ncbi:hypothetical protein ACES2L_09500 [Bdellovibrio bacteriovorus]